MNIYAMKKPKRINAVSISFVVIAGIVTYIVWAFLPIVWPIFQLQGMMQTTCNDAYRVMDDEELMKKLLKDTQRTGLRLTSDNFRLQRLPYSEEELAVQVSNPRMQELMRKRGKECLVEMRYVGTYTLPYLNITFTKEWTGAKRAPLEPIKWEKQCTCVSIPSPGGD